MKKNSTLRSQHAFPNSFNLSSDILIPPISKVALMGKCRFRHLYYIFDVSVSMPGLDEDIVLRVVADENSVAPGGTTSLHISAKKTPVVKDRMCTPYAP